MPFVVEVTVQGVVDVGTVPDEVLLACGRPSSLPSAWWTPGLVDRDEGEVRTLRTGVDAALVEAGLRDAGSGRLLGVLGEVADVVADATLLLLLETESRTGQVARRSVVAAPGRALLDLHGTGVHDLLLATPAAASMLLADLLAGAAVPTPTSAVAALAGARSVVEVEGVLPPSARARTTRVLRTAVGDADDPVVHVVSVVHHGDGVVACWGLPDGRVWVQVLPDLAAVADLAVALLGASVDGPAA